MIGPLPREKRILVCVGPGGAGKTTTAAALAALGARQGRRTVVCTIDPAPRLADALGVDLGPEPRAVPPAAAAALGCPPGSTLAAARLDTERAFRKLVEAQIADADMRRRIFENAIYRQITTRLTGSQEYAANLALYELSTNGGWDLIVLDTPPTANALDFLEAPARLAAAVESPALQLFARPAGDEEGLSWRRLRSGGAGVVRRLGKLMGSHFLGDLGAFLADFHFVLGGFLERARQIEALLRRPDVSFLLVLAPEAPTVDEALYFAGRLRESAVPLGGFVVNRVHAAPGAVEAEDLALRLGRVPAVRLLPRETVERAAERLARVALDLQRLASSERCQIERLRREARGLPLVEIPLLDHDVASLGALRAVADCLAP